MRRPLSGHVAPVLATRRGGPDLERSEGLMGTGRELIDLSAEGGADLDETVAGELRRILASIRHGSVTLIVQDGRIIQIDATRKLRLDARPGLGQAR